MLYDVIVSRAVGVAKIMLPSWMARGLFLKIFTLGKELYPTIFCDAMKLLKNMGGGMDNVFLWWHLCNSVHPEKHYIQQLVIKILSITPHNAGCERIFSIIGWLIKGEHIRETFSNSSFFDDNDVESDYDDDEDNDQNEDENDDANNGTVNNTNLEISRWVNITDKELQELLQMEVNVVIDIPLLLPVDHDSQEFNMEEVLDKVLT
ncbi:unnamed protein product [Rhizophagus irregularis]|uniref:HAT C-terminal dimerisation domain-containing protein n=2 Tax=Rhizophagus irregularis TaxID=588596 RepID=A0A915YMY2_9GLOM|nr:unnamed protein product [Rhizophagus irregularis]CAB5294008.1 unnamed protein product [Rhizophagus irregularis]